MQAICNNLMYTLIHFKSFSSMKASHLYVYFIFQVVWVLDLSPGNVDKQGQSKYNNPQTGRKVIYHYFGRILLVITNLSMF